MSGDRRGHRRPSDATGRSPRSRSHDESAGRVVARRTVGRSRRWLEAAARPLAAALSLAVAAGMRARSGRSPRPTLEAELAHGRRLQRSFVSLVPPDVPGYDIASHYEAAREVGGDFFDLFRLRRRGRPLSIVIADVTGKGIAAALLMAFARPLLHAAIDHTIGPADGPRADEHGARRRAPHARCSSPPCARDWTCRTGRLLLANAGHEPPLFIPADGSAPGARPRVRAAARRVPASSTCP